MSKFNDYEDDCYVIKVDKTGDYMYVYSKTEDASGNAGPLLPVRKINFLEDMFDVLKHLVKKIEDK
jgi:hypothetical protein